MNSMQMFVLQSIYESHVRPNDVGFWLKINPSSNLFSLNLLKGNVKNNLSANNKRLHCKYLPLLWGDPGPYFSVLLWRGSHDGI